MSSRHDFCLPSSQALSWRQLWLSSPQTRWDGLLACRWEEGLELPVRSDLRMLPRLPVATTKRDSGPAGHMMPPRTAGSTRMTILAPRRKKELWYAAIERLVGLGIRDVIGRGEPGELDRTINDAVRALRSQFRHRNVGGLLSIHNEDYGFARNLAGLNLVCWLPAAGLSTVIAWAAHSIAETELIWVVIASAALVISLLLLRILPWYVRQRADRYTESFFGALMDLYKASAMEPPTRRLS